MRTIYNVKRRDVDFFFLFQLLLIRENFPCITIRSVLVYEVNILRFMSIMSIVKYIYTPNTYVCSGKTIYKYEREREKKVQHWRQLLQTKHQLRRSVMSRSNYLKCKHRKARLTLHLFFFSEVSFRRSLTSASFFFFHRLIISIVLIEKMNK